MDGAVRYRIDARLSWIIVLDGDDGRWLGLCPTLNLNADGRTYGELQECIVEVLDLLFTDLHESGELDAFLRAHGWNARELPAVPNYPMFDVPYHTERRESWAEFADA